MNKFSIPANGTDLDLCLFSGQVFRWRKVSENEYQGVDGPRWYTIRRVSAHFEVETNGNPVDFNQLFRLEVDVEDVKAQIVSLAPEMEPCMRDLNGLRMMRPSDSTEVFFSFLCTANNHIKRITPMVNKLAEYGLNQEFPRSEVVAGIPEADLRVKGFGYRGATIPYAAREVVSRGGDEWIGGLKSVGYDQAHRELVSIKGIGNKLADCICLYGLHYDDAVPIDTHLWQAACVVFFPEHLGKALTESRYREVGDFFRDRFGNLAGWAHLFLYFDHMRNRRAS